MNQFNGKRAHKLLKAIAFERHGGSRGEKRAAGMLLQAFQEVGLEPGEETFKIWTYSDASASLEVVAPYRQSVPAAPLGLSGNTPPRGIEKELFYAETGGGRFIEKAGGKIVMIYRGISFKNYGRLARLKVPGIIRVDDPGRELKHLKLVDTFFKAHGKIPQVYIRFHDGLDLIRRKAKRIRLKVRQKESRKDSRNIIAEIKGTHAPDEVILVGGHYDSVPSTEGAHDNAGGTATVVEVARFFASHPPRRTLRFVLFGSEEMGLLGSWNYVTRHKKELDKMQLMVNLDVGGGLIGINEAFITASNSHKTYVQTMGKEEGLDLRCRLSVYSSDCIPFAKNGVPAINLTRGGGAAFFGHTPEDRTLYTDPQALAITGNFALAFLQRLANAVDFPLEKEIDGQVKKEIREYLRRRGKNEKHGGAKGKAGERA